MLRKPIRTRRYGDVTRLAKDVGVTRDTVRLALLGVSTTQLADTIRKKALEAPYYAIIVK